MGARILAVRQASGLTQMQLAAAAGITHRQVQKFESGLDRISGETLQTIADTLGVPVATLFDDGPAADVDPERGDTFRAAETLMRMPRPLRARLMQLARVLAANDKGKT